MGKDVIIACDFGCKEEAISFLDRFTEEKPYVKIGKELYYAEGPDICREIKARGHKIFLDLKLHDIPNTVKSAMAVLSRLDVDMCNLHAAGTITMMEAALEGLTRPDGSRPLLIAVTQLTSTSEDRMRRELLIDHPMNEVVLHYAENARRAGLDGVVCSPLASALPMVRCRIRFASPAPPRPRRLAPTTSWWAVPSPEPRTPLRPIGAASRNLSEKRGLAAAWRRAR